MLGLLLVMAAGLEVGGDAAIRHGLARASWPWMALGVSSLGFYGFLVNAGPTADFGRLMGVYIAVFFVVSQLINAAAFGGRPSSSLLVGGVLIAVGGVVIQLGGR
jgi:small multidrug resistance family-3 protein